MKFTDMMLKNLKVDKKTYSREGGGFTLRIMPSGIKTFLFIYTFEGKRKELNLGNYPDTKLADARTAYGDARKKLISGIDPAEIERHAKEERRKSPTVSKLVEEYIEKHAKKFKKSWEEDERLLNKEIVEIWGSRKAEDIKKRDITLLLESIVERGAPATSNQTLKIVRKMFNFAIERDILQTTPCLGVKALAPNTRRERTLSETEIKTLWTTLDTASMSDEIRRALKLVLVTAQREDEVAGIHTREIDGHWWTIPSERAKNGREHRVYLTNTALDLIGSLTVIDKKTGEEKDKGYIFPCPHKMKDQPIDAHALPVAVRRNLVWPVLHKGKKLLDSAGMPVTENKLDVDKFTPHDLRRTAATFMSSLGYMDEVIDAVLNHVKQGIIRTYNLNKYDTEKQKALSAWERKLKALTSGVKPGKVIALRRA